MVKSVDTSKALSEAKVTKVLTSKIEITKGQENLNQNQGYWAVITSFPLEHLKIYVRGNLAEETKQYDKAALLFKQTHLM